MIKQPEYGWAIWFVGLPGSGKSALTRGINRILTEERGWDIVWLQMDAKRKEYFPKPTYSDQEREQAYKMFAEEAAQLVKQGNAVLMDGSAYKADFRRYARSLIPRFAEVFIECPLEIAMEREGKRKQGLVMADMYRKALERKATGKQFEGLGQVIGVDVEFEKDPEAEFIINNSDIPKQETRARTLAFMDQWFKEREE